jgi:hypothetical protein
LIAYVWPDQAERLARIAAAIDIARAYPPPVVAGDANEWIEAQLAQPQAVGVTRVVMHSVFWQYLPSETQARITTAITTAGNAATPAKPLCWLTFEPSESLSKMALKVKMWPEGSDDHLAFTHPHGASIEWLG